MNILLTGAGFTKNFGGFLADEMWAIIFNNPLILKQSKVRKLMLDDFNYESIYHKILSEQLSSSIEEDDKKAIKIAIPYAYERLDNRILSLIGATNPININMVADLIKNFIGDRSRLSYFFTLNQDLLIERLFSTGLQKNLNLPGDIPIKPNTGSDSDRKSPLKSTDFITLPSESEVDRKKTERLSQDVFHYIKLHGSYNWKSSDGSDILVIGLNKEEQINNEPLLKWYFDIFKEVLSKDGVRLFVIGYGFRDKHINEILSNSIQEHGLQLYVLSPQKPSEFMNSLYSPSVEKADIIYGGLCGYFPYDFLQVFPFNKSETEEYKMIKESFFS